MLVRGNAVRLTPRELDDLVGAAAWLDLYKMHQVDDEHFVFRYVAGEHHDRGHEHELARRLRDALGATARIDIEAAGYIAGERSGKFEPCTSDVAASAP